VCGNCVDHATRDWVYVDGGDNLACAGDAGTSGLAHCASDASTGPGAGSCRNAAAEKFAGGGEDRRRIGLRPLHRRENKRAVKFRTADLSSLCHLPIVVPPISVNVSTGEISPILLINAQKDEGKAHTCAITLL